ncbi:MAG: glycosyltransferase family 1 protein [Actinobacteria bacterium]|nr:glycosyltransferase family 1 protein [Actinomycetota bacterium]
MASERVPLRVLVTSTAGAGHVQAVAPFAHALRDAGHAVLWATSSDGAAAIESLGFDVAEAGMTVDDRRASLAPRLPAIMAMPPVERRGHLFAGFFALAAAPKMRADLGPVVDRFRPDLVIHETGELGAAPVATARGIPHVTVAFSGALPGAAVPMALDAVAPVWEAEGLAPPSEADLWGSLYFHPFPPSFGGLPRVDRVRPTRPGSSAAPAQPPAWLATFGSDRPGLYLTAGTERAAPDAPWAAAAAAIGSLDVDAVATLGPNVDAALLGEVPTNLRVERFVPQQLLLDRVAVVMSHAGAGTMLGAAAQGVPQVVTPLFADQWENAMAISASGAGIMLGPDRRTVDDIRSALDQALHDETMLEAARRVAHEIAAMPVAADHVAELATLC